jgi:hypothetical protein
MPQLRARSKDRIKDLEPLVVVVPPPGRLPSRQLRLDLLELRHNLRLIVSEVAPQNQFKPHRLVYQVVLVLPRCLFEGGGAGSPRDRAHRRTLVRSGRSCHFGRRCDCQTGSPLQIQFPTPVFDAAPNKLKVNAKPDTNSPAESNVRLRMVMTSYIRATTARGLEPVMATMICWTVRRWGGTRARPAGVLVPAPRRVRGRRGPERRHDPPRAVAAVRTQPRRPSASRSDHHVSATTAPERDESNETGDEVFDDALRKLEHAPRST